MRTKELVLASWGVAGVAAVIARGVGALTPIALEPIRDGQLALGHWVVLVLWVALNAYAEGYMGFHRSFSPRVVERALYLSRHPSWARVFLAAPFCMGLYQANRRTLLKSWGVLTGIVALVISVRLLPQPWRGIVDAGVVVGLALGLVSLAILYFGAILERRAPLSE